MTRSIRGQILRRGIFWQRCDRKKADFYFEGDQATLDTVSPIFQGSNDVVYVESWQRRKDGEKRLLAWWCRTLKDKNGKITGALSSAHDITESRAAEELLRASDERFRAWIENASDLVTVIGADGKIQYESPPSNDCSGTNQRN